MGLCIGMSGQTKDASWAGSLCVELSTNRVGVTSCGLPGGVVTRIHAVKGESTNRKADQLYPHCGPAGDKVDQVFDEGL